MTMTLAWSGCRNVRDVGGLPTGDGRVVQPHRLVRADAVAGLDDRGYRAMIDHGVSRVLDLRGGIPGEPDGTGPVDDLVRQVPWIDAARDRERDPAAERTLADVYRGSLERNPRQVAQVVRAFLDAPAGAVVLHCAAGKDRTGMAVALLLSVAGVTRASIVADYAASETHLGVLDVLASHPGPDHERERLTEMARTLPSTMETALAHLDVEHGGPVGYLRNACRLSTAELDAVRSRLLDP